MALMIGTGRSAEAAAIHYVFSGVITSADPSTGVAAGTPFSGSFTYDSAEHAIGGLSYEGVSTYIYGQSNELPGPPAPADSSGMRLQIGDQITIDRPGAIKVGVSEIRYPGEFGYRDSSGNLVPPSTSLVFISASLDPTLPEFSLRLANPSRGVFGSTRPPDFFNFVDFPDATLVVIDTSSTNPGNQVLYSGTIERMNVPEPTTLAIFATAIGALMIRCRHMQRKRPCGGRGDFGIIKQARESRPARFGNFGDS
jgi:hypothetical protein